MRWENWRFPVWFSHPFSLGKRESAPVATKGTGWFPVEVGIRPVFKDGFAAWFLSRESGGIYSCHSWGKTLKGMRIHTKRRKGKPSPR